MKAEQLGANTSCLAGFPLQEAVAHIRRLGFRGITLLAFPGTRHGYGELAGFWFHEMSESERQWLKALVLDFERIAIHAPFAHLPLVSYDPRVEQLSNDRVREAIDAAGYLSAETVIVHANSMPNTPIHEYWDRMVSTIRSLGEHAVDVGTRIGVETGFPDTIDLFVDMLEAVGHHGVGATLDCGHLARYVDRQLRGTPEWAEQLNERLVDMARQLGPMTIHCQLHDVALSDWQDHQAVGSGVIDFQSFLSELQSAGYQGMLELELEERDQVAALVESKRRLESMLQGVGRQRRVPQRRAA